MENYERFAADYFKVQVNFSSSWSRGEIVWDGLPCERIFITSGLFIGFLID